MMRVINSPIGSITIIADNEAVIGVYFGEQVVVKRNVTWQKGKVYKSTDICGEANLLDLCEKELKDYFVGTLKNFSVPTRADGTPFRLKVWDALRNVEYGKTIAYKDIAVNINNPKAIRAVGGANHNNPISIIVPCHRVIGADGSLTGYGGGLGAKKFLLDLEGGKV